MVKYVDSISDVVLILQAALPQGIVPFVFAREYGLHPDILSTGYVLHQVLISMVIVFGQI